MRCSLRQLALYCSIFNGLEPGLVVGGVASDAIGDGFVNALLNLELEGCVSLREGLGCTLKTLHATLGRATTDLNITLHLHCRSTVAA